MDESQNPTTPGPPEEPAGQAPPPPPPSPPPEVPKLTRSSTDRVLAGVCGGLGRHFGVDPLIFRIAAVVLVLMGGAGLLLYLALAVLVPSDDRVEPVPAGGAAAQQVQRLSGGNRALVIVGVIAAVIVAGPLLAIPLFIVGVPLLVLGGLLVPLALFALLGLAVWWLVSGRRPEGGADVARAALLGIGVLILLSVLAVGSFWAAAAGGGTVMASLLIAAGVMLVAGAFVGGARWLILPALAVAMPLALVSAAGIDLDGGVGDRYYDPTTAADIRDSYELGAGSLVVDLRDVTFAPGAYHTKLDVGMGEAVVYVPEHVCVATRAEIGAGAVRVFDRDSGGVDVDWEQRPDAGRDVPLLLLDADVGLGEFRVRHDDFDDFGGFRDGRRFHFDDRAEPGNDACSGVRAGSATG